MSRKVAKNNESGVALLFALGILSLLLVLGLAFASNALLAQKVAHNNSSRSQAKQLALSAVNRIAISIMHLQSKLPSSTILEDYSDIYSSGMDGKDEDNKSYADGLFSKEDSLLTPPATASPDKPDDSTYQKPRWTFIFDKPKGVTGRKIIGRIAYQQVVSSKGLSKITLDNVLRGVYAQSSHASGTPPHEPWNTRWGKTISELNLNKTTPLDDWYNKALDETGLKEDSYSSIPSFFQAYANVYFNDANADKKKAFIERWFTDGTEPVEPEFYRYKISAGTTSEEFKLYHRFNLGDLTDCYLEDDIWYDRFRNDTSITLNKNSADILDKLAHDSIEFKTTDELTPADTGIPFLKQIANEPGTFRTLEARRKQIAANLNDYCDPDSKPTSDVDATNWSVEGVTEPTFTGNERTPYIYELGYRFAIHQGDEAKTAGIAAETNGNIRFRLELYPAVKLAQIYKDVPSGFTGFSFKNSVREITLEGKITGATYHEIKYKYGTDGAENEDSVSISLPASGEKLEKKFSGTWPSTSTTLHAPNDTDNSLSFSSTSSGYPFQAAEMTGANRWYCDLSAKNLLETDEDYLKTIIEKEKGHRPTDIVSGPTSITINKAEITKIAVKRGPLLLTGTYSDTKGGSSTFGVDYVRAPEEAKNTLTFNQSESIPALSFSDDGTDDEKSFKFLLGGIRGIDPRQNLNEDDWFVSALTTLGSTNWKEVMYVDKSGSDFTGVANDQADGEADPAHPFDPGEVTDTSKYDIEKKAANHGPAWTETNHLSTAYIRNAPMQSLWELGVIHRGAAWQTLNLKAAGAPGGTGSISPSDMKQGLSWDNTSGTSYANGDGGILEQVKLTEEAYCYGQVNINMLCSDTSLNKGYQSEYDDQMGQAIFYNIRYGQKISTFETDTTDTKPIEMDSTISNALKSSCYVDETGTKKPFASRTQFLDWTSGGSSLANAFGGVVSMADASDAQREEIVGKTINLLKADQSASNVIQFVVVAQTIRDLAGAVTRVRPDDNTAETKTNCEYGQFDVGRYKTGNSSITINYDCDISTSSDGEGSSTTPSADQSPDDYLYFDEITSEVKMLVTLEKVSEVTGQIVVTSIEYID